jgi:hypothetical protein
MLRRIDCTMVSPEIAAPGLSGTAQLLAKPFRIIGVADQWGDESLKSGSATEEIERARRMRSPVNDASSRVIHAVICSPYQ